MSKSKSYSSISTSSRAERLPSTRSTRSPRSISAKFIWTTRVLVRGRTSSGCRPCRTLPASRRLESIRPAGSPALARPHHGRGVTHRTCSSLCPSPHSERYRAGRRCPSSSHPWPPRRPPGLQCVGLRQGHTPAFRSTHYSSATQIARNPVSGATPPLARGHILCSPLCSMSA